MPAVTWDFSKIPLFPPQRSATLPIAAQPQHPLPSKLAVGESSAPIEHEAERIADQVTQIPMPQTPRDSMRSKLQVLAPSLRPITTDSSEGGLVAPIIRDVISESGQPLDPTARTFFGPRFGFDFKNVRIHLDRDAADTARALGAAAYTFANHIVFGAPRRALASTDGRRLLAHELAHVVQQHASPPTIQRQATSSEKDDKERFNLLNEFTDGAGITPKQVKQIEAAMRGFSLHQLHAMRQAGVRFWVPNSLPPDLRDKAAIKNLSSPGGYWDLLRIIQMSEEASTDAIRHELAHAWDHVRTGKVKPIGKLKGEDFVKAVKNTPELSSATDEKRSTVETKEGKTRAVRLSIPEMLERYKRWKLREESFDNPSTREGYSKSSPREFYAEGYSVFHGGREWNQARLLYYAPELYELLEAEAKQEGLDIPDRAKLEAARKEQKLPD
jgi:hypothetical protein